MTDQNRYKVALTLEMLAYSVEDLNVQIVTILEAVNPEDAEEVRYALKCVEGFSIDNVELTKAVS